MTKSNAVNAIIAIGVWVLVLQNAGILPPITTAHAQARVMDVNIIGASQAIDVNLHSVVGRQLVETAREMAIGVSGENNTLIPIHWGEVTVTP